MSNIQAQKSIQKITEAFLRLLEQKEFKNITVTDIAAEAGIARLTFYRHFEDKEQVLLTYLDALFEMYLKDLLKTKDINMRKILCRSFEYWENDKSLPLFLTQESTRALIQKSFGKYFQLLLDFKIIPYEFSCFQRKFIEGGLMLTVTDWISNTHECTPEDMADTIIGLICPNES